MYQHEPRRGVIRVVGGKEGSDPSKQLLTCGHGRQREIHATAALGDESLSEQQGGLCLALAGRRFDYGDHRVSQGDRAGDIERGLQGTRGELRKQGRK
jgi:hypothetical protein